MIPLHKVLMAPDVAERIKPTLLSGMITEAERVKEFEARLGKFLGTPVLAMNSCTSALALALHLAEVGPGDEVITTPMTCAATNTHVVLRGARLVWADVDPATGLINPASVAARVTASTRAVLVVDWGGRPAQCGEIRERIRLRNREYGYDRPVPPLIQDAAHSFGALDWRGVPAHGEPDSGDYVAWSFQAIKHLTTGDGGALKVPASKYDRARRLRWFGIDRETKAKFRFLQDIPECGYKFHMNDLTAAVGLANFEAAAESVNAYRANAKWLGLVLANCTQVRRAPACNGSAWWFYSLLTPRWEEFVDFAAERGVGSGPVHGRNDAYSGMRSVTLPRTEPLAGVDFYAGHHVAVPCGWWLSEADRQRVAEVVLEWDRKLSAECGVV